MPYESSPMADAVADVLIEDPLWGAIDTLVDSGAVQIGADKLAKLIKELGDALCRYFDESLRRAKEVTVWFRDRRARTGVLVIRKGKVVAAFLLPQDDGRWRKLVRDLDPDDSGPAPFTSSDPYQPPPSRSGSSFSSSTHQPPGRYDVPLVDREDQWPLGRDEEDSYQPEPDDFLPHWGSTR